MKLPLFLLIAVLIIGVASAQVSIVNDTLFNLDNNAYLKVLATQTSTNITIYNSTSTPASSLQFYINGTPIRFTADTNKTLSNISYNNATDVVTYTGNGAAGYLNVSAQMNLSLGYYDFEVDGIINQTLLSSASGWVAFNYTGWIPDQHDFRIKRTGAPGITSWGNNKTNDQSLSFTINTSEFINFNATANQSIDTWSWFKDGVNQSNNYDNFTTSFIVGIHTIKANATNVNGTSNTITWTVTVQAVAAAPSITAWGNNKTNNNTLNLTINASEVINFNATANQSIDTWNWFKDGVNQNNNYDSFTTGFTSGTHTIEVNATNNANGTSNTIVWTVNVQAVRGASLANISALSLQTNAGTNATYILNLTNNGTDADSYDLTVDNPNAAVVGLNISAAYYFLNAGETKIFSLNVTGASAGTFKVNVTATSTNDTSKFAYVNTTTTVTTVVTYIPPTPIILTNNTGNFFVNTTWQAGADNVTDSYNVSVNGIWANGTTNIYVNSSLSAHGWQNVSVYAFNSSGTGTLNTTPAARNTQIPNNFIVISNISDSYSLFSGDTLYIDANYHDADNDPATFARNFTNGTFNTGTGVLVWTTADGDEGTHFWQINVTDGYGSVSSRDFTVTVTIVPTGVPNITGFAPTSPVSNTAGSSRTFNIIVNQTVNVTWYINGTLKKTDTGVTDSFYTNTSAALGIWNVTAAANNANGAVSQQWIWNVTAAMVINITSPANNSVNDTGYVNVTVTLNMPGTALLNWEGANESMNGAGTDFYKNKTGLLSGNYSFRVYANDSGVSNVSETRIITVNRTTTTDLSTYIDPITGNVNRTVNLPAPSSNSTLTIFRGTNVTLNGAPITNITIDSLARVNSTYVARLDSSDKLVGENLSFGPDGARFSPDIQIRLNYTDAQLTAAGINASELRVKLYNTTANAWVEQTPYTLNETGKYIIANVSHFTTFALIGTAAVPITPAPTAAPTALPVSTPGGGGGGAGAISPEPLNNIDMFEITEEYLGANVPASYIYTTPNLVISEVLITPAKNFGITSIRVEMLKDLSQIEGVAPPPGIVYKYANIWAGTKELEREEGIIDAFIGFKVDRSWLAGNNVEEGSIRLLRWDGSKWVLLETAPRSLDEQFVYYIAKTNGFSPFAIVSISIYPSATIAVVETPVLIKPPLQKITESGILLLGYILIAFIIISLVLYKLMRYKKPVKIYEKAMEIKPEDADAWYNRGFDLYEQGKYDEAIKAYDKAIEIIHKSGKERKD